jgi:hypothetical protein
VHPDARACPARIELAAFAGTVCADDAVCPARAATTAKAATAAKRVMSRLLRAR